VRYERIALLVVNGSRSSSELEPVDLRRQTGGKSVPVAAGDMGLDPLGRRNAPS